MPNCLAYLVGACIIIVFVMLILHIFDRRPRLILVDNKAVYKPQYRCFSIDKGAVILNSGFKCPGCSYLHRHPQSIESGCEYICTRCEEIITISESVIWFRNFSNPQNHHYSK